MKNGLTRLLLAIMSSTVSVATAIANGSTRLVASRDVDNGGGSLSVRANDSTRLVASEDVDGGDRGILVEVDRPMEVMSMLMMTAIAAVYW